MQMPGRFGSSTDYRYGFNGMERDDELKGNGNSYDFGARIFDPRIGKFISVDPRERDFSFMSPYCYAANSPILFIDRDGEGPEPPELIVSKKKVQAMAKILRQGGASENIVKGVMVIGGFSSGVEASFRYDVAIHQLGEQGVRYLLTKATEKRMAGGSYSAAEGAIDLLAYSGGEFQLEIAGGMLNTAIYGDEFDRSQLLGEVAGGAAQGYVIGLGVSSGVKLLKKLRAKDSNLPVMEYKTSEHPEISENIYRAQEEGAPDVLHRETNKSLMKQNRKAALKGKRRERQGTSLDEYPFASSKEGGAGARVQEVSVSEQNSQGGKMAQFYRKNAIKDGDAYKVKVTDDAGTLRQQ